VNPPYSNSATPRTLVRDSLISRIWDSASGGSQGHTAATLLLAQGVDQRVVMQILGHSQISMTSKYAHVLPQVMTDAADRIGQALWGSAMKPTATKTATDDSSRSHN
jgi:integrase